MRFEYPHLLWWLPLVVAALIAFFVWSWRTRRRLIGQFVRSRLLANLTVGVSAARRKLRMAMIVVAVMLTWVVLARPQWGFHWEEARQRGLDILIGIDTSRSMLAEDVAPNRLVRAKLAALDLKRLANADRVGLIAFAGSAFLQCPLSFDDEAFRQNVNALDVTIIPQGGTAMAEAIQCALAAFKEKSDNHKVLVLFTDGEDHDGKALDVAEEAAKEGLRIFTVGVGTPNGELLRTMDAKGRADYIRDEQGNVVKSRLNEKLLRDIASAAQGFYLLLTGANSMELLYERGLAPLPKAEFSARRIKRHHERYQWFLGIALVLLVVEMLLPDRKRVPRSEAILEARNSELRKAVAVLLCALVAAGVSASPAKAWKEYQAGHYEAALRNYERVLKAKPNDTRLSYNAGVSAYQAGEYEKALEHLNSALMSPDLKVQQDAYYNRGNAQFRLGESVQDPEQRMKAWEDAVTSYDSALKLDPRDPDAKYNLELVKEKLEELKRQQQQKQNQDQKNTDDKKNKDEQKDKQDQQQQNQQQDQQQQKPGEQSQPDQQKQDQQENQQQDQQQQQEQQQPSQQADKKEGEQKPGQSKPGDNQKQEEGSPDAQGAQPMQAVQMTPKQAQQLLDTLKADEKAMIFIPQVRTNRRDRIFKDW